MKKVVAPLAALALVSALSVKAAPEGMPAAKSSPAFDQIKSLVGTWTGKGTWDEGGNKGSSDATVTYKVTAGGSAVEETLFPGTPEEMVTIYYMDGDQVMLTHYCAAGNQPSMKLAAAKDPKVLNFEFTKGSNMKDGDMHMHSAQLTMADADHLSAKWVSMAGGKEVGWSSVELARQK